MKGMRKGVAVRYAESLAEVYEHIEIIGIEAQEYIKINGKEEPIRPYLWYRGHAQSDYVLNPNLFRGATYKYNADKTYSNNHLREDYRFQSFMSRNFDNVTYRMPQSVIEWQEVMQHFFTKTRLMDWSESLIIALEFALESFLVPVFDQETEERRKSASPVIWILKPTALNKRIYDTFSSNGVDLIEKALPEGEEKNLLAKKIAYELRKEKGSGIYYNLRNKNEINMNAMISLSALEILRNAYKGNEIEALRSYELNPFFYLLLRYYSDGLPVELGRLTPLAIIHPYHSERIRMQKGVFTVFPYYVMDDRQKSGILNTGVSVGMEEMKECMPYLYKIQIMNPERVANELILAGARRANLYPEMENISKEMENVIGVF